MSAQISYGKKQIPVYRTYARPMTGLENDDGKGDYSFFTDDCWRFENGVQTTSGPHPAPPRPTPPPAPGAAASGAAAPHSK